jgi:negative regulator of replication initiation
MMRILSNFPVKDGKGAVKDVPVTYGDLTRQVASIIRENSENKLPTVPRIAVYLTGLELDKDRLADATYTRKTNIRERAYDSENEEYLNYQGKNYTVERLIPTPYMMRLNADIWASNTDQKLQLLEQILVLFNPSLEMQTTDNFIDWTSITVVNLENVTWSNRSIPVGVDSEIDIATLTFSIPI